MKTILTIAKTELRNLFYSPVAWFLGIVFLVQCAVFYTGLMYPFARIQDILLKNNPSFKKFNLSLTQSIFLDSDGIFTNILQNLYLFIPLLTMGLIGREINNGTIKLLYSSPIKIRDIILGKFFAIMTYNLLLVLIVGIFVVSGMFNIEQVDYGLLLSATLGFYLLVCAYTAIGLFMSSLSTYQILSAVGTFLIIFILSRIDTLWQKYDFVRDLTYFLSMSGRTFKFVRGLITTKDVLYFLVIMCMFLGFTYVRLKGAMESRPWFFRAGRYAMVLLVALTIGYISSRPVFTLYWDTTAEKTNTLHPRTQELIRRIGKDTLEVTLFSNLLGDGIQRGLPEGRNDYIWNHWDHYLRFKPDIQFRYVSYYDTRDSGFYRSYPNKSMSEIAAVVADMYDADIDRFISPEQIRKKIDLEQESRVVMQLKYKGKTEFLRTFDDAQFWPDEMMVDAALKRLLEPTKPRLGFVMGNLERSIYKTGEREFFVHTRDKNFRRSLINLGFDMDTLSLDTEDIPEHLTALVLADPKTQLSATTMRKLEQYIGQGGNMLIFGEPGKQQMLNPLLEQLGVRLADGSLVQVTYDEMPNMVKPELTETGGDLAEEKLLLDFKYKHEMPPILMPGVTAVPYSPEKGFVIKPLMMTARQKTWLKAGPLVTDSSAPVFNSAEGDITRINFPVSVALTRKMESKEQRIIVCGDADFMSNLRGPDFLARAFYSWLDNGVFPIYIPPTDPKDLRMKISERGAAFLRLTYVWILPALVLLVGSILLIRRKRK